MAISKGVRDTPARVTGLGRESVPGRDLIAVGAMAIAITAPTTARGTDQARAPALNVDGIAAMVAAITRAKAVIREGGGTDKRLESRCPWQRLFCRITGSLLRIVTQVS